jgi:Domain of unknown function (DUF6293)/DUF6293 C-terminal winged helix domain
LRIHLAPIGFEEVLRIVAPMIRLRADAVILLTYSQTGRERFSLEKVVQQLKDARIPTKIVECDILDTSQVVNQIGAVVTAAPQHEYFYNVSTGPRTASVAGVIAGMFWQVRPYFVSVDDQAKPVHFERDFPVTGDPRFIPTFQVSLLDQSAVVVLEHLAGSQEPVSKRQILVELKEKGIVGPRQKAKVSPQALYGQLDAILRKLESWGFVELKGRGKSMRIAITDKGIEGRKMFFHVLNPQKPLDLIVKS